MQSWPHFRFSCNLSNFDLRKVKGFCVILLLYTYIAIWRWELIFSLIKIKILFFRLNNRYEWQTVFALQQSVHYCSKKSLPETFNLLIKIDAVELFSSGLVTGKIVTKAKTLVNLFMFMMDGVTIFFFIWQSGPYFPLGRVGLERQILRSNDFKRNVENV